MADITSRARRLSQGVAETTVAILGTGKVSGAEITATGGVVTIPSGSRIAWGARGPRPAQAVVLTEDIDVSAVNGDELYARQLPGGASYEIAAAVATPVGAIKLADLSGSPVDTVVDTSPARIGAVDAKEVGILDAAANYAGATVEAALAEIGPQLGGAVPIYMNYITKDQIGIASAEHVEWRDVREESGEILVSAGAAQLAGLITLPVGRIYRVESALVVDHNGATAVLRYQWRNNTDAVLFGNVAETNPFTVTGHAFRHSIAGGFVNAIAEAKEIELRVTGLAGTANIRGEGSSIGDSFVRIVAL